MKMQFAVLALLCTTLVKGQDYGNQGSDWTVATNADWKCLDVLSLMQSPISNIVTTTTRPAGTLAIHSVTGEDNFTVSQTLNRSIKVVVTGSEDKLTTVVTTTTTTTTTEYILDYYEIRSMSEHKLAGDQKQMEIQMAFKNTAGSYVVLAHLLEPAVGDATTHDIPMLDVVGAESRLNITSVASFTSTDIKYDYLGQGETAMQALSAKIFTYSGSWTYPPCEEGVTWYVAGSAIPVAATKLDAVRAKVLYTGSLGNYRGDTDLAAHQTDLALSEYAEYTYTESTHSTGGAFSLLVSSRMAVVLAAVVSLVASA
eukprot:Lankesteria_metandrocarpae@DN5153_c0_g1_i2.p1